MKTLLLTRSLSAGGTQRQMVNLANALAEKKVDVHIATFYKGGRMEQEIASSGRVQLHSLNKAGRWDLARFGWRYRDFVARHRFDVVYSFLPGPNSMALLGKTLKNRPKIVWGIRDSPPDFSYYDRFSKWAARAESTLSPLSDHIVVNSRAALEVWTQSGFPREKLTYIANGIDTMRFVPNLSARDVIRRGLGMRISTVLIGIVGRIDPKKDHKALLSCASMLLRKFPDAQFLCIGGIPSGMERYAEGLKRFAVDLNLDKSCHWLGDRSDVPQLIASLDVLVLSSGFGEGFPNVVAEGMACMIPCVVTDVGDAADVVESTGSVVPPGNPAALSEAVACMLALTDSKRLALGVRSRNRVQDSFSIDRMADNTLDLLHKVLDSG